MYALGRRVSRLPFAPVVALMFAAAAATLILASPIWLLERETARAGIAGLMPAAAPPLGSTARMLLTALAAIGAGALAFVAGRLVEPLVENRPVRRSVIGPDAGEQPISFLREAGLIVAPVPAPAIDTTPPPISATRELGPPLMSEEALAQAPVDRPEAQGDGDAAAGQDPVLLLAAPATDDQELLLVDPLVDEAAVSPPEAAEAAVAVDPAPVASRAVQLPVAEPDNRQPGGGREEAVSDMIRRLRRSVGDTAGTVEEAAVNGDLNAAIGRLENFTALRRGRA